MQYSLTQKSLNLEWRCIRKIVATQEEIKIREASKGLSVIVIPEDW
jgi:hypothetical protein